jgi:hypothetical protein
MGCPPEVRQPIHARLFFPTTDPAGHRASGLRGSYPGKILLDVSTPASVGTTSFFESQNVPRWTWNQLAGIRRTFCAPRVTSSIRSVRQSVYALG